MLYSRLTKLCFEIRRKIVVTTIVIPGKLHKARVFGAMQKYR
jgi:hypothetical protein